MRKSNVAYYIVFIFLIGDIFKNWLLSFYIIGGDWPFFFQEYISHFNFLPPVWNSVLGNGFGGQSVVYALDSYLYFTGWLFSVVLHIPWPLVYKLVWFGMFLALSLFSSIVLFKTIFPKSQLWQQLLAAFLYTTNTYILLVVSGGQMGVSLGYAIAPLVLKIFINFIENIENKRASIFYSVLAGFILGIQIMFDFRIAYIVMAAASLYFAVKIKYFLSKKRLFFAIFGFFLIPLGSAFLLHAFWILPILLTKSNPTATLGSAYTSLSSVKFFSFATFENALGLLHPYWPENIFGKVGFMKPEFLILPILAFVSLVFINKKHKVESNYVLFFALLGLIGVFLAKGANDPFGFLYLWMFNHIPGFIMFRDPTKWYTLIAISYSILIPFTVWKICEYLRNSDKFSIFSSQKIFILVVVFYLLFLIRPALFGQLDGTLVQRNVPLEYVALKNKLINDNHFYRTLWIPKEQRFSFTSNTHPAIEANLLFSATDAATLKKRLSEKKTENYLADLGVKYIIIPSDLYAEIFIDDRKYSQKQRDSYEKVLDNIPWIKKIQGKKLTIYETKTQKDHFWLKSSNGKVSYVVESPTLYKITLKNVKKNDVLIFSENYSAYWRGEIGSNAQQITNNTFDNSQNSFILPKDGSYTMTIYFSAEKYYLIGRIISLITLIAVSYFLLKSI